MEKKLVPYSVYLPSDLHKKLKRAAKHRQASSMVRDAIGMIIEGNDAYNAGYKKGLEDAARVVYDNKEAQMIAVRGKDLGSILTEQIEMLTKQ